MGRRRERGRGRGRSVTRLYGHETSSSPSSTCASSYIGTKQVLFQPPTTTASLRPPCPDFRTLSVANIVTGDGGKSLYHDWHSQASNSLSLSLDCRRYFSLVETRRHISQGWTLHRIKAGLVDSRPTVCGSGCCIACST